MERIDDLQRNGLQILQDPDTFCFGIDAVLLADFAKARSGEKVMDLCSGNGIVPLLMYGRYPSALYEGLELQSAIYDLACRSIRMNQLEEKIRMTNGDVRNIRSLYPAASFDVVTVNPPYMKGQGKVNEKESLRLARHEITLALPEVIDAAAYLLPFHGRFYMIHRAARLAEIMTEMTRVHLEPKKIRFVHPMKDKDASQVLIEASLRGGQGLTVLPPLITYDSPGHYTEEILSIYNAPSQL